MRVGWSALVAGRENRAVERGPNQRIIGEINVVIVFMMAMVVAASVMMMRRVLMGLKVEPRARVRMRVSRVEASRRKEFGNRRRRPIDLVDHR